MTEERKYRHVIWCNKLSISIFVDDTSQWILHQKDYELCSSKTNRGRNELVVFTCWWQGGGRVVVPPLKPTLVIIMFTATTKRETPSLEDHCFIEISLFIQMFTLKSASVFSYCYFPGLISLGPSSFYYQFSDGEDNSCPKLVSRNNKHSILIIILANISFYLFICPSFHFFPFVLNVSHLWNLLSRNTVFPGLRQSSFILFPHLFCNSSNFSFCCCLLKIPSSWNQ